MPFFEGGYTFPSIQEKADTRFLAWKSLDNKLFFAGEAYHPYIYSTMAGALEMGEVAAREILYIRSLID